MISVRERRRFSLTEYGTISVVAKLGPFDVEYDVWDYKGQRVTTGATANISLPTCGGEQPFQMTTETDVVLREDKTLGLYVISNGDDASRALVLKRAGVK